MKKIWDYLTPDEILDFYKQIESMCEDIGRNSDEIIDKMYELDLKNLDNPVEYVNEWIQDHEEDYMEREEEITEKEKENYRRKEKEKSDYLEERNYRYHGQNPGKYDGEDPEYDENGPHDWKLGW